MIALTLLCAFSLYIFFKITGSLHRGALADFDNGISAYIFENRSEGLTNFMIFITDFGNYYVYLASLPIIFFSLYRSKKHWRRSIEAVVVVISAFVLNTFLKLYFVRPRPDLKLRLVDLSMESYSYPSGHSMTAIAFYGFIIYLVLHHAKSNVLKYLAVLFLGILIVVIGISRIYLGAHYPSDVLAGFAAGLFWLLLVLGWLRFKSRQGI